MNTSEILTEFIEDTGKTVSDRTLNKYKDAIDLFALFLRDTRYDENEDLEYDVKEEQKRVLAALDFDFSEVTSEAIEQFLGYFLIRKVMDTISFKDDVSKRMHKFVKWAYQKGYMSKENYEDCEPMVKRLKTDVRLAEELFFVLADYVDEDQPENCEEESYEDYFQIKKVTPGKLYLESIYPFGDELDEEIIVKVPEKISSMCKADWQIFSHLPFGCLHLQAAEGEWIRDDRSVFCQPHTSFTRPYVVSTADFPVACSGMGIPSWVCLWRIFTLPVRSHHEQFCT